MANPVEPGLDNDLNEFFDFIGTISDALLREVKTHWREHQADPDRLSAARHGREIVRSRGRQKLLDDAFEDLRTWLNQRTGDRAGIFGITSQDRIEAAGEAIPAFVDALLAILAADELLPDEHDILLSPLRRVLGVDVGGTEP